MASVRQRPRWWKSNLHKVTGDRGEGVTILGMTMIGQVILGASIPKETSDAGKGRSNKEADAGYIQKWDLATGVQLGGSYREYYSATGGASTVGLFPLTGALERRALVTVNERSASLNYYVVDKERPVHRFFGQDRLTALCVSPREEGEERLVAGGEGGRLVVWDVASGEMQGLVSDAHFQRISVLRMSVDGGYVVSGSWDGTVKLWSMEALTGMTARCQALLTLNDHTARVNDVWLGFGLGRNCRLFTACEDGRVRMYDLVDGQLLATFVFPAAITRLVVTTSETLVIAAGADGVVYLVDLAADVTEIAAHTAITHDVDVDVGARRPSQSSYYSLVGHQGSINALCLSMDEEHLIGGDEQGNIIVWHLGSRQVMRRMVADGVLQWLGVVDKNSYERALGGGFRLVVGQPQRTMAEDHQQRSGWTTIRPDPHPHSHPLAETSSRTDVPGREPSLVSTYAKLLDHVFAQFI